MRQIVAEVGVVSKADGSAVFEMGNTKVIAAVYGPREIQNKSQQKKNDHAVVLCEYSMAQFSTGDRRRQKFDRLQLTILLKNSLLVLTKIVNFDRFLHISLLWPFFVPIAS
ncbi:Ribosomal protein S5 domain 2-type fold [Arabidopsis suecica]|uniref:Ribosomal protein S5 domain 2-type fold n=1 Tax=Arabidopsis suecica TaxID=45249 RepID=A0A8T2AGC1_ARASU|nr:Ribosomal protein S5 domain 2-type fold [Arabidopsis suecica]